MAALESFGQQVGTWVCSYQSFLWKPDF